MSSLPVSRQCCFSWDANITRLKHFVEGTAVSSLTLVGNLGLSYAANYLKLIPDDPCLYWDAFYKTFPKGSIPQHLAWKVFSINAVIIGGIGEELVFRGVIQDLLLKKLLGKVIEKVSPGNAAWTNGKTAKISRIVIASVLFGALHLVTPTKEIPLAIALQAFNALFLGAILGAVKESRLGLIGSIGCHMMHNAACATQIYAQCVSD